MKREVINIIITLTIVSVNESVVIASFSDWMVPILGSQIILDSSTTESLGIVEGIKTTNAHLVVDNKHEMYSTLIPEKTIKVNGIIFKKI